MENSGRRLVRKIGEKMCFLKKCLKTLKVKLLDFNVPGLLAVGSHGCSLSRKSMTLSETVGALLSITSCSESGDCISLAGVDEIMLSIS